MAPLPKRRHSTRRGGKRKASIKYTYSTLGDCPQCKAKRLPHRVCPMCGFYDGKEIVKKAVKSKKSK